MTHIYVYIRKFNLWTLTVAAAATRPPCILPTLFFFFFTLVLALPYVTLSKIGAHHPVQLRTTKKKKKRKEKRKSVYNTVAIGTKLKKQVASQS